MAFGDTQFSVTANYAVTPANLGNVIYVDATAGPINLTLPDPSAFGVGLLGVKKIDLTSNLVQLLPASGTFEDGMPSIPLSLECDGLIMASDGMTWRILAPGLSAVRHSMIPAEHDITVPSYNISPTYDGYLMLCDTAAAGGSIMMVLPWMAQAAFHHQCFSVDVMHFDSASTSNIVSVVSQSGEAIVFPGAIWLGTPGASSMKLDLPTNLQCRTFWTDGARWTIPRTNGL